MSVIVAARRLVDAGGDRPDSWLRIDEGRIVEVGDGPAPDDARAVPVVMPGFVDLHCHGGGGGSYTSADEDSIARAAVMHRTHGTTTSHASLVSADYGTLERQIRALIPFVDDGTFHGIHLEGPWISPRYCGAHDPATLRAPHAADVARILDAGAGRITMVTIAPELPGALEAIGRIVDAGVIAAVGHTGADAASARAAIDAGATVATHLFNAMPPLLHRDSGPVGVLLADDRVTPEVIADGVHVDPEVVALTLAAAGGRAALVTDAMAGAGGADGRYRIGDLEVEVDDGVARLRDGGSLAGSTLLMDSAVRRSIRLAGRTLAEASEAASLAPAKAMGLVDRGRFTVGMRADLVALDDELQVTGVMRGGEWL